jgi:two-component system cell cycle sensor histidine kinase/response regulator CckA
MATNVTEREGMRAWKLDKRFQQLVELTPDGILVHDDGRIVLANASALRLAGATGRAQVIGQPIETFLDPPYLKGIDTQLTNLVGPIEFAPPVRDTFHRLDGSDVPVEVRTVPFMEDGHPSAHIIIRDITERLATEQVARQLEEHLQQAQRIEAVGALAGGVAHEVNNMMAVVLGTSDLLLHDARLPTECLSDVHEIIKAADRAAAVTRQLLDFGRRAVNRPQSVELRAFVHDMAPAVRRLLGKDRLLIVVADTSQRVWADSGQLKQVLVNLALNAGDATPPGGTVTIIVSASTLRHTVAAANGTIIPTGGYATLAVRDTGTGIDAATQTHIFEPFFTTKPVGQGTGLGLAAVYGIVTQNHGYITVASEPGQETTFTVYLPALLAADVDPSDREPPDTDEDATHTGTTVLVVEDEPMLRATIARSLERDGFRVLQATDGADAINLVNRYGPPHIVLTDVLMPGISGAEMARRLRERWPTLPIIFMSGYSAEELGRQGTMTFDGESIQKPFKLSELAESVTRALSRVDVR